LVVGSQARILYADAEGRIKIAEAFNKAIREKKFQRRLFLAAIIMMFPERILLTVKHPIFTTVLSLPPIWQCTILWVMPSGVPPG